MVREERTRWTLKERFNNGQSSWFISKKFFGSDVTDIFDFEPHNYTYFLDNVSSVGDLIRGLRELSPLVDDALSVAEGMNKIDFASFKLALIRERKIALDGEVGSIMPSKYNSVLMPSRFPFAYVVASGFRTPLGSALVRIKQYEEDNLFMGYK